METAIKVPFFTKMEHFMATQPNPEFLQETMFEDHGTKVLITNPLADKYLDQAAKRIDQKKYGQWCGGQDGWDDYTERWHTEKP